MQILDTVTESFHNLIEKNSKLTITIIAIMVFLFISGFIIVFIQAAHEPVKGKPVKVPKEMQFISDKELISPDALSLTQNYYFSRTHSRTWNEEEVNRYFTEPGKNEIDALSKANDSLVKNLEDSAP